MPALLYEIGCEELPSSAVYEAADQLPGLCAEHLDIEPDELYAGPRRLAVLVRELPAETPETWVQGPPVRVGEKAAEGCVGIRDFAVIRGRRVGRAERLGGRVRLVRIVEVDPREPLPRCGANPRAGARGDFIRGPLDAPKFKDYVTGARP